ncbi:hypothetical protein ACWD5Q_23835 [Streptomyces sp. NPDC002513]
MNAQVSVLPGQHRPTYAIFRTGAERVDGSVESTGMQRTADYLFKLGQHPRGHVIEVSINVRHHDLNSRADDYFTPPGGEKFQEPKLDLGYLLPIDHHGAIFGDESDHRHTVAADIHA